MSSLDKLAIRGIRSFDHQEMAVMQFFTPLTVIVGHNGSGKTTIIECLKYATTGDQPPNTKGGAFVHDPSIAGTSEVKAQVKLRFTSVKGQKMLIERRLQVTKKKNVGGLSMKSLEANISVVGDGKDEKKRQSLSTKCASLDEEAAIQLGVSKAVLENVIFCHQEDSNWPLSEAAPLKKKFDDIFEATKYTKALDAIKGLRKEQTNEIKIDKEKLSALKTDRDRATKLRKTMEDLSSAIAVKSSEHEDLEVEIAELVKTNKTFFNQATKYQDIIGKAETLQERKGLVKENLSQLRASLNELTATDIELSHEIENFAGKMQESRTAREGLSQKLEDETDGLAAYERKRSQAQTAHGRLLAQKQRYTETLETRQTLIVSLAERHKIAGYDHTLTEEEMTEFEFRLDEAIKAQSHKLQTLKQEARKEDQERQSAIQELKSAQTADERARKQASEQIRAINIRIATINRQLDASTTTVADITMKENTLTEEKGAKKKAEDEEKAAGFVQQYRDKNRELRELEDQRDELHAELTKINTQSNVRAKLSLKRSETKKKDEATQALIDKSTAKFRRFTKQDPTRDTMEAEVTAAVKALDEDLIQAEQTLRQANRELQGLETSVTISKKKVRDLKSTAEAYKTKIKDELKNHDGTFDSIEEAIEEAESEVVAARNDYNELQSFAGFYESLLEKGQSKHKCVGCDRALSKKELPDFEAYCKKKAAGRPAEMKEIQGQITEWEKRLAQLKKVLPVELALARLEKDDLPAAEEEADGHNAKLPGVMARSEDANTAFNELKAKSEDLQTLRRTAADVTRMNREVEEIARDIVKLESELSASGSTATSDEIQEKVHKVTDEIRAVKSSIDQTRNCESTLKNRISALNNSIHVTEMELAGKRQELKDKEQLEQRKESERAEVIRLEAQVKEFDNKLLTSGQPIRVLESELADARAKAATAESTATRELTGLNKSSEQLDLNMREIKQYRSRGVDNDLAKTERDLQQHDLVITDTKGRISTLQNQIATADKQLAESDSNMRNLKDNQRYRKEKKSLANIEEQLESLDEQGARESYRKFETEYNEQRKKQSDRQAMQAKLGGELEMMRSDLTSKREEIDTEYKDIETKYKMELVKVKTTEVANDDLGKYHKALDAAIMQFHSLKMKEINDTIADLWTKTYQGTDIDKIMIKSDAEGKIAGNKQSYNYRVVMFKDTTEMDMRGRCSAGQKVLASIIIRLALAESFGTNCGIMALDEPTTNLDQDNIQALARALAEIIEDRKSQANFQLIVITHDESFLQILGEQSVLDKYWRVSRGDGGQVSTIERQRLS